MRAASFRAELLKLRKRPAVWVLGALWLALLVLFAYALPYAFFAGAPELPQGLPPEAQAQEQAAFNQQKAQLYPVNLVPHVLSGFDGFGAPIALIFGVLAVGSEYSWGTLNTILSQRPGRLGAFFAKMLALAAVLALFVVLAFAIGTVGSLLVALLENGPLQWPSLIQALEALGAGGVILAVWAALGVFLATLFRGTALAIGLGLFYALALEGIISGLPISNEFYRQGFLGQNSAFLATSFASDTLSQGLAPPGAEVGAVQAALVLCAYIAVFVIVAALVFRRRDVS